MFTLPFQGGCIVVATYPGLRRVAPYPGLLCYAPSGRWNACLKGTLLFLFRSQSHVLHDQNVQTPEGVARYIAIAITQKLILSPKFV
jgi:hypothetical protein